MYRVEVDYAPAYELLVSLDALMAVEKGEQKSLELGADWIKRVRGSLPSGFMDRLAALDAGGLKLLDLLVWQCPEPRTIAGFLGWFGSLSAGDLYEQLAPFVAPQEPALPRDLAGLRDRAVPLLTAWDAVYMSHLDPAIQEGLAADAKARRALIPTMAPDALVELATTGVYLDPALPIERVVLVPQYHYRPWNLRGEHGALRLLLYPADALPSAPGTPSPALLRLTRALSDESRLRILRYLAVGERGFTDVVRESGLAKSTVHHHLVALRAAGLVRVRHDAANAVGYSLRDGALDDLDARLTSFLHD